MLEKINKTKFFEKIDKIDKPLQRLTKKNRKITNIRNVTEMWLSLQGLEPVAI